MTELDDEPLQSWGRDEMNLVELPLGPVSATTAKTLEVVHTVYDQVLKREVTRHALITGSDAYGLPRPIDDQVLIGLKALTHEAHFVSPKVYFSRYELCRVIGWQPSGKSYQRLEDSFNRLCGTMFKFKDAWFDKGESEWLSKSFHLLSEVQLCSRDRLERSRITTGRKEQKLSYFVWSDTMWKSFTDSFIKSLDLAMFRRIAAGKRRDVPLRLYRILDKRFHKRSVVRMNLVNLATGILGLSPSYSPSQTKRIVDRAARCLIESRYLDRVSFINNARNQPTDVVFARKKLPPSTLKSVVAGPTSVTRRSPTPPDHGNRWLDTWLASQNDTELERLECQALTESFGTPLERQFVHKSRDRGEAFRASGAVRKHYVHRYQATQESK